MEISKNDFPQKLFIKNLQNRPLQSAAWINGTIEQVVRGDILIINDGTARAKISGCQAAWKNPIDTDWFSKEIKCCIIGLLLTNKGLPEIIAKKVMKISEDQQSWAYEVQALKHYLDGDLEPNVVQVDKPLY